MNFLKKVGLVSAGVGGVSNDQLLLIISIFLSILGILQEYYKKNE